MYLQEAKHKARELSLVLPIPFYVKQEAIARYNVHWEGKPSQWLFRFESGRMYVCQPDPVETILSLMEQVR